MHWEKNCRCFFIYLENNFLLSINVKICYCFVVQAFVCNRYVLNVLLLSQKKPKQYPILGKHSSNILMHLLFNTTSDWITSKICDISCDNCRK